MDEVIGMELVCVTEWGALELWEFDPEDSLWDVNVGGWRWESNHQHGGVTFTTVVSIPTGPEQNGRELLGVL